ncbi:MAG: hypothetical protein GY817_01560 [bacterium]|nr:hypothetical protein [bacterium]
MAPSEKKDYGYLREVSIQFKEKQVNSKFADLGSVDQEVLFDLFKDLESDRKEKLITISLDINLKIICYEVIAIGNLHTITRRPFETIRASIPLNAYGIVLLHNHPSGNPQPSEADIEFTKELLHITKKGGIVFYDHMIVGNDNFYSIARNYGMDELYFKLKREQQAEGRKLGVLEGLEAGVKQGQQIGQEQGIELGERKGKLEKAVEIAREMKVDGKSFEEIIRYTKLAKEKVERL